MNGGDIIKVTKSVMLLEKSYPPGDHILRVFTKFNKKAPNPMDQTIMWISTSKTSSFWYIFVLLHMFQPSDQRRQIPIASWLVEGGGRRGQRHHSKVVREFVCALTPLRWRGCEVPGGSKWIMESQIVDDMHSEKSPSFQRTRRRRLIGRWSQFHH